MKKTTVMVFGTFDIFHKGHESFLKQAKKLGDHLIVVIARDKTVEKVKKQRTVNNEQERLRIIKNSGLADEIIPGNIKNKYAVIQKYKPDVIALGYDQKFFIDKLEEKLKDFKLSKTKIVRLKPHKPEIYKSSKLK
jgi:FAD synthetase